MPPVLAEPAPRFQCATDGNARFAFDSVAGRWVLLAFLGSARGGAGAEAWAALRAAEEAGTLDPARAIAFAATADGRADGPPMAERPGLRVIRDADGAVARLFGAEARPLAVLLDPTLRVFALSPLDALPAMLRQLPLLPAPLLHAGMEVPPPVLLVPRVLEPELCRHLVALYEQQGGEESGFMREVEGRTVSVADPAHKRRQDMAIADEGLRGALRARFARRLAPEIQRAFQFAATRIERYIVARYDAADRGHFRAHRDNTTKGTAHRRFAVTINLNDGFEGGELWFPEFSPRRFRPPPGAALVFSCSLLHEATPVTGGTRYATLPFLYDDAAAALREENRRFVAAG